MKFRTYFDVDGVDRSGLASQVAAQHDQVHQRLRTVRRVVAIMSGKGGVGKSYCTAGIATAAAHGDRAVGVLDADLRSPTVARLLDARGPLAVDADGVRPATGIGGVRVMSSEFLLDTGRPLAWQEPEGHAFVWRGTLEAGALREFLADVVWGELDLLLIDLPPGADGVADLRTLVPDLSGIVAITIPSDESERSVSRAMRAAHEAGIPLLGVIENMSGVRCAACDHIGPLFTGNAGRVLAAEFGIPLLAQIPFDPASPDTPALWRQVLQLLLREPA